MLLVHGFMSTGATDWARASWIEPLQKQGRDVVIVDLPGHGSSGRVASAREGGTSHIVDALAATIAAGGSPVDIVAYSLGARLSWTLAALRPELVNRLVLGGLSPFDPFSALDFTAARAFVDAGVVPNDPLTAFIAGMVVRSADPHSLLNLAEGLASEPFRPSAQSPSAPVLFIAGTEDQMATDVSNLEAFVPGSRTVRVPGDHLGALHSSAFREAAFAHLGLIP